MGIEIFSGDKLTLTHSRGSMRPEEPKTEAEGRQRRSGVHGKRAATPPSARGYMGSAVSSPVGPRGSPSRKRIPGTEEPRKRLKL